MKYRILTTLAGICLLLCIVTAAFAVRSWWVEDWMARSRWEVDGPAAREISWTLLSQRGTLAVGRREIVVPISGNLEPSYWEGLAEKPEYSWHAIRLATRREQRGETLMQRLGFHTADISQQGESGIGMTYSEFGLPHWFVVLCLLAVPMWWVILRRRRKRGTRDMGQGTRGQGTRDMGQGTSGTAASEVQEQHG